MGCDVHAVLEVKIDGTWRYYGLVRIGRDYGVFEAMGHVARRSAGVKPITDLRGFPKDADFMTRVRFEREWGPDAHSPSWLSSDEMAALDAWWKRAPASRAHIYATDGLFSRDRCALWFFGNSISGWWVYPEDRRKFVEDIRLVFWFDN